MHNNVCSIADKAELLLLELRELTQMGPHFKVIHRFRKGTVGCHPGEEVFAVVLVRRGRQYYLCLPLALLLLFDYLAHHTHVAQSSAQIEAGIRADAFYAEHGRNAATSGRTTRRISKSGIKEYVKRLRRAFVAAFREAGSHIDPRQVLVSQLTVMNQVGYRLRAEIEWVHIDSCAVVD
jgi:hypothetical protein